MSPKWPGPLRGGLTQSLISKFLECPYRAYLYFVEGLEEPSPLHPNLIWGDVFHVGLEHLIPTQDVEYAIEKMKEYQYTSYPSSPETYEFSTAEMLRLYDLSFLEEYGLYETEISLDKVIEIPATPTFPSFSVRARGKMDGVPRDLSAPLLEHKCKGKIDLVQTLAETPFDMQVNLYCHIHGLTSVKYDLIRIPEAQFKLPYRRNGERASSYIHRLFHDYRGDDYPITYIPKRWIRDPVIPVVRQEQFLDYTFYPLCRLVQSWYDLVSNPAFDPEDPSWYGPLFYRTPIRHFDPSNTEKFKCNYHSFLTEQIEKNQLVPVTSYYSELP